MVLSDTLRPVLVCHGSHVIIHHILQHTVLLPTLSFISLLQSSCNIFHTSPCYIIPRLRWKYVRFCFKVLLYKYCKFSNKSALPIRAHPFFQNLKDEFKSFPTVYDSPIFNKIWVVTYCWKSFELCFSNKGAPMLCLGALRPYWRIYGSSIFS